MNDLISVKISLECADKVPYLSGLLLFSGMRLAC
jgi:hypothetical protein